MDALLSAVASELIGRLASFLIRKYWEPNAMEGVVRLQRALLRAHVVVEEAEGRQVTNRALLLQLNQLREEMCRGTHALDSTCRRRAVVGRKMSRAAVSGSGGADGPLAVVDRLEAALSDVKEFVVLLSDCPRVTRQPYSAYLFLERCMFGRQMEKEQIIDFLLQPRPFGDDTNLGVLPIIGPENAGKHTLVEHVCMDERVRTHFAKIQRLSSADLTNQGLVIDPTARSLFVIHLAGDVDEESWRRFCTSVRRTNRESQIVTISRTRKHSILAAGTTVPPLVLRRLRQHELWYLFRTLAFGAANPEERPDLVSIAMEVFAGMRSFAMVAAVNIVAASLQSDLSARSWRRISRVLSDAKELQRRVFGEKSHFRLLPVHKKQQQEEDAPLCLFYNGRKTAANSARSELPKVRFQDLLAGRVVPGDLEERFDVLVWQSRIPPFCSYVATCDMEMARKAVVPTTARKQLKRRRGQVPRTGPTG